MSEKKDRLCVILGGGGHARVLIDCLQLNGAATTYAILDPDRALWGCKVLGVPVVGDDERLSELIKDGVTCFVVGLGGTGNNEPRWRLFEFGLAHGIEPLTVIHPRAIYSPWAQIGRGGQVLPGAIINAGAVLGENVLVNSGAIVEHDCEIGDNVHIASGARLASSVYVGHGAHIGAGATIRQCIRIGDRAIVGAGAVVIKDVVPEATVVGVPAYTL